MGEIGGGQCPVLANTQVMLFEEEDGKKPNMFALKNVIETSQRLNEGTMRFIYTYTPTFIYTYMRWSRLSKPHGIAYIQ